MQEVGWLKSSDEILEEAEASMEKARIDAVNQFYGIGMHNEIERLTATEARQYKDMWLKAINSFNK